MTGLPPLYILRHGETEWNAIGRLQGHHDSGLTATGLAQAQAQRQLLGRADLTGFRAFSSPQGRAFHTAAIALAGLVDDIRTDDRLREIGLGEWAGMDRDALIAASGATDGFDLYERAPGGEGYARLYARCTAFLRNLDGPAVLITHGITSRMLRAVAMDLPSDALRNVGGGQGVVFHLTQGRQFRLALGA